MVLDHVAIAVRDLGEAEARYVQLLKVKVSHREEMPSEGVRVSFFSLGDQTIELIAPLNPSSTVAKFLEKHGEGVHHLAYRVSNIADEVKRLKNLGWHPLGSVRPGSRGSKIIFFHPKDAAGVLCELIEL